MLVINDLPLELLALIFQKCAEIYPLYETSWFPIRRLADLSNLMRLPLVLSAVCKHWRGVAHSTPSLWHPLVIKPEGDTIVATLDKLEKHMQRLENLFYLYVYEAYTGLFQVEEDLRIARLLGSFIEQHSHRWLRIELHMRTSTLIQLRAGGSRLAQPESDASYPHLQRLAMRIDRYPWPGDISFILSSTSDKFPQLRSLSLSHFDVRAIQGAWARLTTADLHHIYLTDAIPVMQNSPNLIHLRLPNTYDGQAWADSNVYSFHNHEPITLPFLQTLEIGCMCDTDTRPFFSYICAPTLKHLRCTATLAIFPWTSGYQTEERPYLFPPPDRSSLELIVIVEQDNRTDLEFIQGCAPSSHVLHLSSFPSTSEKMQAWAYSCDGIPPLWSIEDQTGHLCPLCFLHEIDAEGNGAVAVSGTPHEAHPRVHKLYPPVQAGVLHDPRACFLCRPHAELDIGAE